MRLTMSPLLRLELDKLDNISSKDIEKISVSIQVIRLFNLIRITLG